MCGKNAVKYISQRLFNTSFRQVKENVGKNRNNATLSTKVWTEHSNKVAS
jgi:hypothetical protein